jgi:hypothetical protein
MTVSFKRVFAVMSSIMASAILVTQAQADPLFGRDLLKFQQNPMIATPIPNSNGSVSTYLGHDELSTAYGFGGAVGPPQDYQGRFMADDFSDKLTSPVVHVKWWGSYRNDFINPQMPVNKFLIAFESDIPAGPAPSFSRPGQVLQFDVVNRANVLTPGSGLFTEKLIRGPDALFNESLYEYNAELHFNRAFFEQKDTVYWLKIAALVDAPPGITFPAYFPPPFVTQWGWHNRDYTIQNNLASNVPVPGEFIDGTINGVNIWHFQDDSVQGDMRFLPFAQPTAQIFQNNMSPQNYIDVADGPGPTTVGVPGIGSHSKDLAFELYTIVPEPATCSLVACSLFGLALSHRRRGKQRLALR